MIIKICGLTDPKEAVYLNENHVDLAGMVLFFPKSKRNIDISKAKSIMEALDSDIKRVAVVVQPTLEQAWQICQSGFDYIQIHGNIEKDVYDILSIPILKAFNVADLARFDQYEKMDKIKGYVFDAQEPGSGKAFDWSMLENLPVDRKLTILAGGLHPDNVKEAIQYVHPDGVDVSSGVENENGVGKSPVKIAAFVKSCRGIVQNV